MRDAVDWREPEASNAGCGRFDLRVLVGILQLFLLARGVGSFFENRQGIGNPARMRYRMYRKCQRWKTWIIVVMLTAGCVHLLFGQLGLNRVVDFDSVPNFDVASGTRFIKSALLRSHDDAEYNVTLFHPLSVDYSDIVGLRGLHSFDCMRALEGFPPPPGRVQTLPSSSNAVYLSDQDIIQLTGNCKVFREKYGYHRHRQLSQEELNFPLAFNILLYKEVFQLHLLLRAIYRPHNSYCLHVDGYAEPAVYEATRRLAACLDNVFMVSKRENVSYRGISRLQADISCMRDHYGSSKSDVSTPEEPQRVPWRYLLNLPSQEFPLKTNEEIVKILTIYNGSNDIEGLTGNRMLSGRFKFKHTYVPNSETGRLEIVRTNEVHEPPPYNITVVKGSAYGAFSREFVNFVLFDERARALLEWCRAVDSPDEYYWASLNHNPHLGTPGGYSGPPDEKPWLAVYAAWPPRDLCMSERSVRGICIFGVRDLPQLISRKELFGNKFFLDFQPETLHCLDEWLFNKSRFHLPMDTLFYRQLPFIKK